jgi:GxxExxY protein
MRANEASHAVIGAALKVHNALGPGLLESAYDACLFHELKQAGLQFEHEVHLPVVYEGVQLATAFRVDYIVEKCLILELKCVERVLPVHRAQVLSYQKLTALPLGLLINFNVPYLRQGIFRIINAPEEDL